MAARGLGKGLDSLIPNALGETKTKKETAAKSKTETTEGEEPQNVWQDIPDDRSVQVQDHT